VQADGLVNLNAQSINNYNMLYLTSRHNVSDIVELDTLVYDLRTITTSLRFKQGSDAYKYIKFVGDGYVIVDSEVAGNDSTKVQLRFTDRELVINHISENTLYRLAVDQDTQEIAFRNDSTILEHTFNYVLDPNGYLTIHTTDQPSKILTYVDGDIAFLPLSSGDVVRSSDQLIEITNNYTPLDYNIDQNWISYDRNDLNLASVDSDRSTFKLPNQFIVSTSYNNIGDTIDVNFFNLKTNVSEGNYIKRGSSLNRTSVTEPGVDFRFYTSLNTGNNQERGNENIVLTYVFYDKDIVAKTGTDTAFSTSDSIYPYSKLNINDTKFVSNGAYASYAPNISDQFYKLRHKSEGFNDGRYLCTWLSGNAAGNACTWVDRYYYPNIISKEEAYTTATFNPSFISPIDTSAYAFSYKQEIATNPLFDKKSDVYLEPNTRYIYKRISKEDLQDHITSLSAREVYASADAIPLEGETSFAIEVDKINDTSEFTLAFDLYLSPNKTYGHSIIGNLTNYGFSVLNDTFITPIIVSLTGNDVYYSNTYPEQIGVQTFNKPVKDVIRFDSLDNYLTICDEGYVYEVKYNNTINRLKVVPSLSSYLSYAVNGDEVTFLTDTSDGKCVTYNKLSAEVSISAVDVASTGIFYSGSAVIGVMGTNVKRYDPTNICYLDNDTIYKRDLITSITVPVVQSSSGIIDYAINEDGSYLLLHNVDKITMLNKNRAPIFTQTLSSIPLSGTKCEFTREYSYGRLVSQIAVAGIDNNGVTQVALYDYDGIMRGMGSVVGNLLNTQTNFTNYNYHLDNDNDNTLRFRMVLENPNDNADILEMTLVYDYSDISEGFVNLAYVFDSLHGSVSLSVNGQIHDTATFDPAKYTITRIFSDRLIVGATGFYNGLTLSEFIAQPSYYYVTGTTIRNMYVYNKPLKAGDLNAINLLNSDIQPITLSIPCGQRSNIEEIVRYFKFSVPGSKSNHVNIEVKNSGITDEALQTAISVDIRKNISKYTKSDIIIDDITFVDYSPV
jgi:hypothetical protein